MERILGGRDFAPRLRSALVDWSAYGRGWLGDGSGENLNFNDLGNPPRAAQTDFTDTVQTFKS
eukprot:10984593-Prorocentrum_lima.AAC.1